VAADADFAHINKLITRFEQRKNDKVISLNESKLRAEEEELKQEKKEEEEAMKQAAGSADKDIFPNDYYNKELVNITADYLQVLTNIQASRK
jgi:carboxyl-terminal processing protease